MIQKHNMITVCFCGFLLKSGILCRVYVFMHVRKYLARPGTGSGPGLVAKGQPQAWTRPSLAQAHARYSAATYPSVSLLFNSVGFQQSGT